MRTENEIQQICHVTRTDPSDVSINLENASVYVWGKNGKAKKVVRTIYRARFEADQLIGHVLNRSGTGEPWPRYHFNPKTGAWHSQHTMQQ